ncbi:hypothetical protein LguiB_003837 [Lonicera macranthoides]
MEEVAYEFFKLPLEEKMKLYSDDPSKTVRLSTSFNVTKETVHNWRDYLRLHCFPLHQYTPDWPSNPPSFNSEELIGEDKVCIRSRGEFRAALNEQCVVQALCGG